LRSLPVKLTMHNIGHVASAANVVFLAGEERTASPRPTFMFHAPTFTVEGEAELDAVVLMQRAKDLSDGDARTCEVLAERTRMTSAQIEALKVVKTPSVRAKRRSSD
jgi:ATP-dependent protease ClpP protease subunit